MDDPEFQITISQQVLEEKKYDTEIESYINILTLKSDDHVNTFSRSTDDQRSANLKEIKSVLSRKVGCSQDILSSELSRNLMEVASIPNSPKFFDLYVTRMVLPNLNKLYPGSNTRKEACYSLVQSSIPLTSIMKLMEKYGTESVLNYAEKLQGLTGVYIGVNIRGL